MIRVSVSLIEWEGPDPGQGRIPAGARRLGRAALVTRPGQKGVMLLGAEHQETLELAHGLRLDIEPNVGANGAILDLRFVLEARGVVEVSSDHGITIQSGRATVLPLGRVDGKSLAAVVEASVVDASGLPSAPGE